MKHLSTAIKYIWAGPGLISKYQMRLEGMVPVVPICCSIDDDHELVWDICVDPLSDIQLDVLVEYEPRHSVQFA